MADQCLAKFLNSSILLEWNIRRIQIFEWNGVLKISSSTRVFVRYSGVVLEYSEKPIFRKYSEIIRKMVFKYLSTQ